MSLPALDQHGFLKDLNDWSPAIAKTIAEQEGIQLTDDHWEVIYLLREFYSNFQLSPAMRALVKAVKQEYGPEKGNSIHLNQLFPPSPAKIGAKIAGLPKPANCL